ncbi:MAG: branched-chain amino acid ABC transporter permease [Betaproteobacteria bacterium]|nr:branched-chain amino acid ABC transporter permease [Betaproteobacteria bacterium]
MNRRVLFAIAILVWAVLPMVLPRHFTDLLVFAAIYSVAGLGVGLLLGHCGIVTLAQSAFYAIGAYASAIVTVTLKLPMIVGVAAGLLTSAVIALALGWPVLRLRGYFLAVATLALAMIASALFFEWDWLTGGTIGLGGIPKLGAFGVVLDTPQSFYYAAWITAALAMLLVHNLVSGRTGLAMRGMRDAIDAARVLAIDIHSLRVQMFVLCAMLGSLSGSLFAHYTGYVSVASFSIDKAILFLLIPVIGGAGSIAGIIVGALFITFVPEVLSKIGDFHGIVFGLALVVVVIAAPHGIVGTVERWWQNRRSGESPTAEARR